MLNLFDVGNYNVHVY